MSPIDPTALNLPTLGDLQSRGVPVPGRTLTDAEQAQKRADMASRPKHLRTKHKSEQLCSYQFNRWGAQSFYKARDDERYVKGVGLIRVATDVDFVGSLPIMVRGDVRAVTLKVESKGITLRASRLYYHEDGSTSYKLTGSLPLSNLSAKERGYLDKNREAGGLSVVHIAWWFEGNCQAVHVVPWRDWVGIERALLVKAAEDKRFQGKSLRYHADGDLLAHCLVEKVRGRWALAPGHWLTPLLAHGQRPEMF